MSKSIKAFARLCEFTHAEPIKGSPMFKFYSIDKCEVCDCDVQAANAVNVKATEAQVKAAGITVAPAPEEGGWSDKHGAATCGECCY